MLTPLPTRLHISVKKNLFTFTFISHAGLQSRILAQALHSLVRVSRRVNEIHLYNDGAQTHRKISTGIRGSCKQSHTYLPEAFIQHTQPILVLKEEEAAFSRPLRPVRQIRRPQSKTRVARKKNYFLTLSTNRSHRLYFDGFKYF